MYVDPGTLMPIASALAVVGGVLMMFWRRTVSAFQASVRWLARLFKARSLT
jgi:hypothetical protein